MELTNYKGKELTRIDDHVPLEVGDRVVIKFGWLFANATLRAYELSVIDQKLGGRRDFRVLSYVSENDYLLAEVEVIDTKMQSDPTDEFEQAGLSPAVVVFLIAAAIASVVWALGYAGETWIEARKVTLVEQGKAPPGILQTPSSSASKWFGYAIAGGVVLIGLNWYLKR